MYLQHLTEDLIVVALFPVCPLITVSQLLLSVVDDLGK